MFITACPPTNAPLPFKPFPALMVQTTTGMDEEPESGADKVVKRRDLLSPLGLNLFSNTRSQSAPSSGGYQPPSKDPSQPMAMMAPTAGDLITFSAGNGTIQSGSFVTFVSGLNVISAPGMIEGESKTPCCVIARELADPSFLIKGSSISAKIPPKIGGQTYVFVTKSSITSLMDSEIEYGPAVLEVKPAPPMIDFSEQ
jgi:hypothetical protein